MNIHESVSDLIGNTPLVELSRYCRLHGLKARIVGKFEAVNPAGSVKDRVAKAMIEDAIARGVIDEDTVIIEPTAGNTGIGLAAIAASHGLRMVITMPESMSAERRALMSAFGAEVVLTDAAAGMKGAIDKADELAASYEKSFIPGQFTNPVNPQTHELTTGPEIWNDTDGEVDVFVAGVGTGGTLSGVGSFLKKKNPDVEVVAVEPSRSPLLSEGHAGPHGLEGIGANFVPDTLDTSVYDRVVAITEDEAFAATREMAAKEGLLVGISSGAAVAAATKVAEQPGNEGKLIVVLLPDTGERYLSTGIFG